MGASVRRMADDEVDPQASPEQGDMVLAQEPPRRRAFRLAVFGIFCLVAFALLMAWLTRKQIADEIISGQLEKMGLPATYTVESIGPDAEVLRNLVVGDPARPDLTVERVKVAIVPRWGMPDVGRITLEKPRLHGSYKQGKVSFGSLDKVLFTGSKEPFRLPDLDVAIVDGRGRLDSDFGQIGLKVEGVGKLRDGFSGVLAAIAPEASVAGCRAERASLYGKVTISGEKPHFAGPVRLAGLACPKQGLRLGASAVQLDTTIDALFDGVEGKLGLAAGTMALGSNRLASASGEARFTFRKGALTANYDLAGKGFAAPQARLASLASKGVLRAQDNFARLEVDGDLAGGGLQTGDWLDGALADAQHGGQDTLAAPLIGRMRAGLRGEAPGSRIAGNFVLRQTGSVTNLTVPQGRVTGTSGQALLALSRFQMTADGLSSARLSGNFSTGGRGLPQIAGRMERGAGGGMSLRAAMAEYAAGEAKVALPQLVLLQNPNGTLGFAGNARLSGPLPGGAARNLTLPIEGNWLPGRGLLAWRSCVPVGFDSLTLANLTLQKHGITLCPPPGGAIFASDARGTRIAAGASKLDLAGSLGKTPIRIAGGALGLAWPGTMAARSLDIEIGPRGDASKFRIGNLNARIGKEAAGHFTGGNVELSGIPLDVREAVGDWRYADGRLSIAKTAFRLEDRWADDRFHPLTGNAGELQLYNNVITARAAMLEPKSLREVVRADIRHDLGSGRGTAELFSAGIVFDRDLQPDTITPLALGVVANASGTVRGEGRIAWDPETTVSTGRFTTDSFDFAAAFGPVHGMSGTVNFTDLLNLVTAPDQRFRIASINPGIEVNDGELSIELRPGNVLAVNRGHWPFLGGTLTLEPTQMQLGVAETRRYTLTIAGLDAAKFVERMDMGNISATGTFDGALPLVFDENGGRLEGGQLVSRVPGGNVSYVGALTYKDLSAMANFAFDALKSLDYRRMQIDLNGPLEGEIVTRVSFDGIGQGATARRNFITKQIAKLPLKFNVNLRAPFFKLVGSLRSLYDPSAVRDPRELGLMSGEGRPLQPAAVPAADGVQPSVSEKGL